LLSELKLDLQTYDRFSSLLRPNIITYLNKQDGIRIETFQNEVMSFTYFPSASDSNLKCAPNEAKASTMKAAESGTRKNRAGGLEQNVAARYEAGG
jgi:hypothetical protein